MKITRLFVPSWLFASALLASCAQPAPEPGLLIKNVNVIDVVGKRVIPQTDILIRDGLISAVDVGMNAVDYERTFDAQGAYATAGLYDAHVHIDVTERLSMMLPEIYPEPVSSDQIDDDQAPFMAYGVTGIVVLDGNDDILAARERAKERGKFVPRILAGPILDDPERNNPLKIGVSTVEEGVAAVENAKEQGYDLIKPYHIQNVDARNAVIARADELGLVTIGHLPPSMSFEESIVPGFDNIAHLEEITRNWDGEDRAYLSDALELVAQYDTSLTPHLLGYREIVGEIEDIDAKLASLDWELTPPLARIYATPPFNGYVDDFGGDDIRERAAAYFSRIADVMAELTLEAHQAGILLLAGTDVGNPTMLPGQGLYRELALMRSAGLDGYDTLAAATINVARLFGEEDARGSIEPGKAADIVLFSRNPIAVEALSRGDVLAVIKDGFLFDRERIDYEIARVSVKYDAREAHYLETALSARQMEPGAEE